MTPIKIGGVTIPKWNHDLSPYENYKASLIAELIVSNKQKQQLKESFENAKVEYGEKKINNTVVLNDIDFELWIKANINDDSMVCLGDKIIREVKRMYDQLEGNVKLIFSDPSEAYDKLEDGIKDAGSWIDDEILQGLDDFFGNPVSGTYHFLEDGISDIFDNPYYITTYLCKYQGKGKDDPMLIALYDLKRNYAFKNKEYVAKLIVYDKIARCLIKKCLRDNQLAQVYFHDKLIVQTYNLVCDNKKEEACQHYIKVVMEMVEMYD